MANKIIIKNRTSDSTAAVAGDLDTGELAINTVSGKLYFKDSNGGIKYYADSTASATTDDATALAIALG